MTTDTGHNRTIAEMDMDRVLHPVSSIHDVLTNGPTVITGAHGITVTDSEGRDYLDCGAGLWCANIGYGNPEIGETAKKAMDQLSYFHMFAGHANEPIARLADQVLDLFHTHTPATHLSKVFFGQSGSDANDTHYKLIKYYNNLRGKPHKKKMIAREGGYHGLTHAATGLTGIPGYHKAFDAPGNDIIHALCPHYYRYHEDGESEEAYCDRLIADLEDIIEREGADTIAAFFAEPVMGTGGVFLPPKGYFQKVQALLKKHDILFVADEVITGFGRLGSWFAAGHYGFAPDMVTLAKGITSAYFPLSASVISEDMWQVLKDASPEIGPMMHGYTYTGHPVGGAIALKNLEILERDGLIARAADTGPYLLNRLKEAAEDFPYVGDVRGEGMMAGVEYMLDPAARIPFPKGSGPHKIVSAHARKHGLLSRALPHLEVMAFSPPLCMTRDEADEAANRFRDALAAARPELDTLARH
ncbi:aminotransferase [Yunchengibacter salinarum]|uniref:aminotransferase n=1 Tax=Yunchengibacter salinarum TaxID=3133399 RepID=UPI0035B6499C